jgi:two-component system, LytTR family, response regulator
MSQITAIITDDEESARDVLGNLLKRYCPEVELIGKCSSLEEAVELIKLKKPSLVFLDVEMPRFAGYEITQFIDIIDFEIIFVTAYDKYAIRAFELAAIDYLLKPIDIDKLQRGVRRVVEKVHLKHLSDRLEVLNESITNDEIKYIIVPDNFNHHRIKVEDIIAIEASGSYSKLYTPDRTYVMSKNLKQLEELLIQKDCFFRTHKSWIVNMKKFKSFSKSNFTIELDYNITTKLSKFKKEAFEKYLLTRQ